MTIICRVPQVIDLLVRLLQIPLEGAIDQTHLTRVFKAAYDVLYTYMIGNSRKNALYFAKYIDFFQTQISVKVMAHYVPKVLSKRDSSFHPIHGSRVIHTGSFRNPAQVATMQKGQN